MDLGDEARMFKAERSLGGHVSREILRQLMYHDSCPY